MIRKFISIITAAALLLGLTACDMEKKPSGEQGQTTAKERLYPVWKLTPQGKLWGYMSKDGKLVVEPAFEEAGFFTAEGTAVVKKDGKMGILSEKGGFLLKPVYDTLEIFGKDRWVGIRDGSWTEMVDRSGKAVYETGLSIQPMEEGGARVQEYVGDRVLEGYIDDAGKVLVEPKYLWASSFTGERAVVKTAEGTFALIDRTGKVLTEFPATEVREPMEGSFAFSKTGKTPLWGYMDMEGKVLLKPAYANAQPFHNGVAVVGQKQKGVVKYGLIDPKGAFILRPKYAHIEDLGNSFFAVYREYDINDGQKAYPAAVFSSAGKRLTDYLYYEVAAGTSDMVSVSDGEATWLLDSKGTPMSTMPRIAGMGVIRQEGDLLVSLVEEERAYFTLEGKVLWETPWTAVLKENLKLNRLKFRPDRGKVIYYPALAGLGDPAVEAAINQLLKTAFVGDGVPSEMMEGIPRETVRTDYSVQLNKDILIVEQKGTVTASADGAVQNLHRVMHFNIQDGAQYQLKDLFREGSDWPQVLAEAVRIRAAAKAPGEFQQPFSPESVQPLSEDRRFKAGRFGLVLYYDSAELGGVPGQLWSFEIPYAEILKVIRTEGSMWNAFLKQDM